MILDRTRGAPSPAHDAWRTYTPPPWASRTLIGRKLKKLEDVISVSVVEPALSDEGWKFGDYPGSDRDTLNGFTYMHEVYTSADPHYTGRATVPVLWDKKTKTIVNNESADILRMLNSGFGALADNSVDLYPEALRDEHVGGSGHELHRRSLTVFPGGRSANRARVGELPVAIIP